jgi:hypothetical protein
VLEVDEHEVETGHRGDLDDLGRGVEDLARRRLDPAHASGRRRPNPLAGLGPLL